MWNAGTRARPAAHCPGCCPGARLLIQAVLLSRNRGYPVAQDKSDGSFRVIDRRSFTEDGELRPEAREQVQREKDAPKPAPVAPPAAAAPAAGETAAVPAVPAEPEKPVPARSPY